MVGDKIKKLRNEKGIYQKDLADILSVSKSTVAMWETNKREPDLETIKNIAKYFGVSTDSLISFEEEWDKTVEELNKEFEDRNALLTAYLEKVFECEDDRDLTRSLILQLPRLNTECLKALNYIVYELAGKEENMSDIEKEIYREINK